MVRMLLRHLVCRALSLADRNTGKSIAASVAIIATTTKISIRVIPRRGFAAADFPGQI